MGKGASEWMEDRTAIMIREGEGRWGDKGSSITRSAAYIQYSHEETIIRACLGACRAGKDQKHEAQNVTAERKGDREKTG